MKPEDKLDSDIVYYQKVFDDAQRDVKQRITFQGLDKTVAQLKYLRRMLYGMKGR